MACSLLRTTLVPPMLFSPLCTSLCSIVTLHSRRSRLYSRIRTRLRDSRAVIHACSFRGWGIQPSSTLQTSIQMGLIRTARRQKARQARNLHKDLLLNLLATLHMEIQFPAKHRNRRYLNRSSQETHNLRSLLTRSLVGLRLTLRQRWHINPG